LHDAVPTREAPAAATDQKEPAVGALVMPAAKQRFLVPTTEPSNCPAGYVKERADVSVESGSVSVVGVQPVQPVSAVVRTRPAGHVPK
jgi:hypothetical protein